MLTQNSLVAILQNHQNGSQWCKRRIDGEDKPVHWLLILEFAGHCYGLLESGKWVAGKASKELVTKPGVFVPFLPILEASRNECVERLTSSINQAELPEVVKESFPFDAILECALSSQGSYWRKLAISWIEDGYPLNDRLAELIPEHPTVKKRVKERIERVFEL